MSCCVRSLVCLRLCLRSYVDWSTVDRWSEWIGVVRWSGVLWSGAEWIGGRKRSREEPSGSIEWSGVVVYWTDLKNRNNKH